MPDPSLVLWVTAAIIAALAFTAWLAHRDNVRAIGRMDRSLENMDRTLERMDRSVIATERAADGAREAAVGAREAGRGAQLAADACMALLKEWRQAQERPAE